MASLAPVSKEGFGIVPELAAGAFVVRLSGSCDSQTTALLDRFLGDLHVAVLRASTKAVTVDCENLYFMNSSAVKCFVTSLAPAERYHVTVRTNRFLAWHQRSFGSISRSAPEVITIAS